MKRILIVFSDVYELDNTREILREGLFEEYGMVPISVEKNADMALACLEAEPHQLVITDLHIPTYPSEAVNEEAQGGIVLLREIEKYHTASILVVPTRTNALQYAADELYQCELVEKGSRFAEKVLRYSRKFLQDVADPEAEKVGYIDLEMDLDRNLWQFRITGEFGNSSYFDQGLLEIRSDRMSDLIDRSCNIQDIRNWERELRQIGKTLCEEILENNKKFMKGFYKLSGKIDKQEKIRIRFAVEKKIHPVLLEALIDDDMFVMLNSPVFRSLAVPGEYHLAFNRPGRERRPKNCLIIESDTCGTVPEVDPEFKFLKLDNIAKEASWLFHFLTTNREAFNIDTVELIQDNSDDGRFVDRLRNVISRQNWEIVHYAGHSYYEAGRGQGYLLFPSDSFTDVITLQEFSKWLRDCKTQLVFLSSCHSSEENFVFELAANKVPAIIGFRWDIDDDKAFMCAQKFYTHLFQEHRTLEYAFLETRRDMHREHPRNRIWAAPILIMQEK